MFARPRTASIALLLASALVTACLSTDKNDRCTTGSEACACYGNGTCDQGLSCYSGLCVDELSGEPDASSTETNHDDRGERETDDVEGPDVPSDLESTGITELDDRADSAVLEEREAEDEPLFGGGGEPITIEVDDQDSMESTDVPPDALATTDEQAPVETDTETDVVESDPVETDPVESEPVESDRFETDVVESDPVETDPVETDQTETDSVETDVCDVCGATEECVDGACVPAEATDSCDLCTADETCFRESCAVLCSNHAECAATHQCGFYGVCEPRVQGDCPANSECIYSLNTFDNRCVGQGDVDSDEGTFCWMNLPTAFCEFGDAECAADEYCGPDFEFCFKRETGGIAPKGSTADQSRLSG